VQQFLKFFLGHFAEQLDRIVVGGLPKVHINALEQLNRARIPAPLYIPGNIHQRLKTLGQRWTNRKGTNFHVDLLLPGPVGVFLTVLLPV